MDAALWWVFPHSNIFLDILANLIFATYFCGFHQAYCPKNFLLGHTLPE